MSVIIRASPSWKKRIFEYIDGFNVYLAAFDDPPETNRDQKITTKIYLVLLSCCMLILVNYTAFTPQTFSIKVENPSLVEYQRLEAKFNRTLSCPCSQIAISPGSFVNISVQFHQVSLRKGARDIWRVFDKNCDVEDKVL